MRALVALGAVLFWSILTTSHVQAVTPPLQLPWPTGDQHRINSGNQTYNCGSTHMGSNAYAIDFEFTIGQSVAVVASGTIVAAVDDNQFNGGRGNYLEVDHGNGFVSRYLHLRNTTAGPAFPPGIASGVAVQPGVLVAYSGNTGGVAAHLHFDLKLNTAAYRPEPMSRVTGGSQSGDDGFGKWGLCTGQTSPYWTSWPPYATMEGGLIRGSDGKVYVISAGQKRWITSAAVFNSCGYRWSEIMALTDSAIGLMPPGSNVSSGAPCPKTLVRATGTDPVYHLSNSFKYWISSSTVFGGCKCDWGTLSASPRAR